MQRMRRAVSFAVLLLGVACGSALGPNQSLQPDKLQGAPGSITIISARFGSNCKGPSDDVTALFRQACDGKWRCAVRTSRQLSTRQEAVNQAARETTCGGALFTVDWICGEGTGKRGLRADPGARFRPSCARPDAQDDEASVASQPEAQPVAAPLAASGSNRDLAVHGRFLGTSATGVADRKIVVGSQQTTTDQTGAFSLSDVPATYDLSVIEKDGAQVSLFLGLSRRDPVVAQAEWQGPEHTSLRRGASISGRLAGAELSKADGRLRATPQFFSAMQPLHRSNAGFMRSNYPGDMSRCPISWRGPSTISGRFLASIHADTNKHGYVLVGIASKLLTLEDGDNVSEDLTVTKLSSGHIAGTWDPAQNPQARSLSISYELSDGSGEFWVGGCPLRDGAGRLLPSPTGPDAAPDTDHRQSFDCPLPDVSFLPGRYRVFVVDRYSILDPERERLTTCGIRMGSTDLVMPCNTPEHANPEATTLPATVQFTSPAHRQVTSMTGDARFEWEAQDNSIYAIVLSPGKPFNLVPRISFFTRKTSFRWTDLTAHGIGFPTGAVYFCTVTSIPVSSVDQVASLDWWYGRAPEGRHPEAESSGVKLMDPTAPIADPLAPSNVKDLKNFPSGLPVCGSGMKGQVLGPHSFGRMVTITGGLVRNAGICLDAVSDNGGDCSFHWAITGVAGSSLPIVLGKPAGSPRRDRPEPPIPVAASGLLALGSGEDGPLLKQANLCLIPAKP
jgi:hypothetical protein